jgi:hypothetical protein
MHELTLARAALPAPTVCLGMLLRPYSLGHELWLIRENNAALRGSPAGLPGAVLICSQTWTELAAMRADWLLPLKLALWKRRTRKLDGAAELEKFLAYRAEGLLELPLSQVTRPDCASAPRLAGAPFILRLQQWLMLTLDLAEPDAWDYPAGLATIRWATAHEEEGRLNVKNAHEIEFERFVAEHEAKRKEGTCPA